MIDGMLRAQFNLPELDRRMRLAGSNWQARRMALLSLSASAFFLMAAALAFFFFPIVSLVLLLCAMLSLRFPHLVSSYLLRERIKSIEAQLPFCLRYFSALLRMGMLPERALERTAEMGFWPLGEILRAALSRAKKGMPLEMALGRLEAEYD